MAACELAQRYPKVQVDADVLFIESKENEYATVFSATGKIGECWETEGSGLEGEDGDDRDF